MNAGPTVWHRRLGSELKRFREAAEMSRDDAAKLLEFSGGQLWRIEAGQRTIRIIDVERLLGGYGVTDPAVVEAVLKLARGAKQKSWYQAYEDILNPSYRDYLAMESEAATIRCYQPQVIPGQLQAEPYARAILAAGSHAPEKLEKLVELRLERQKLLYRSENPAQLHVVLDEAPLRRPFGGRAVLRDQLRALVEAAERPNITVQVLPDERAPEAVVLPGAFIVMLFPELSDIGVVFLENMVDDTFLESERAIETYGIAFDRLSGAALDPEASMQMIRKTAEELETVD